MKGRQEWRGRENDDAHLLNIQTFSHTPITCFLIAYTHTHHFELTETRKPFATLTLYLPEKLIFSKNAG